ncbi:MAG: hypothetical protein RIQ89_1976 [Bacteroidota bacterium]|jgi:signal transduction histidine kinase
MIKLQNWWWFVFLVISIHSSAFDHQPLLSQSQHIDQLNEFKKVSESLRAKNLNRFALEKLFIYEALLDSFATVEIADSIAAINANYTQRNINTAKASSEKGNSIKSLAVEVSKNDAASQRRSRNSLLALGVFLCLIITMLIYRFKKTRSYLQTLSLIEKAHHAVMNAPIKDKLTEAELTRAKSSLLSLKHESQLANEDAKLQEAQSAFALSLLLQQSEEKRFEDVNLISKCLIDHFQSYYKKQNPELLWVITADLEKNLPKVNIESGQVAKSIAYILINAFESVIENAGISPKGFKPQVTLSTRVLPRFVQIRIRDNGIPIPDADLSKIFEPFYSTKTSRAAAGLGLYQAQEFITKNNGEIKVESEKGRGNDIYLKIYTAN